MPVNPVDVIHMSRWKRLIFVNQQVVLLYQLTWLVGYNRSISLLAAYIAGNRHIMPKKMVGMVLWWIMMGILKMSHPLSEVSVSSLKYEPTKDCLT